MTDCSSDVARSQWRGQSCRVICSAAVVMASGGRLCTAGWKLPSCVSLLPVSLRPRGQRASSHCHSKFRRCMRLMIGSGCTHLWRDPLSGLAAGDSYLWRYGDDSQCLVIVVVAIVPRGIRRTASTLSFLLASTLRVWSTCSGPGSLAAWAHPEIVPFLGCLL